MGAQISSTFFEGITPNNRFKQYDQFRIKKEAHDEIAADKVTFGDYADIVTECRQFVVAGFIGDRYSCLYEGECGCLRRCYIKESWIEKVGDSEASQVLEDRCKELQTHAEQVFEDRCKELQTHLDCESNTSVDGIDRSEEELSVVQRLERIEKQIGLN